jgi:uncharacterized protein YndB with AHSA1/START domain
MNRILGSMHQLDERRGAVRMEDVYDTEIADLWSAITEPERLARWIATIDGDLRVGGTIQARFTSAWEGPARIDVCEEPHRLVVTLAPGTKDEAEIEARLTIEGQRTRLVVEDRGLPLDVLHLHGAGWQAHFEDLSQLLAGGQSNWQSRWEQLSPVYKTLDLT